MSLTTFSAPFYDPAASFYTGTTAGGIDLPPNTAVIGDSWYLLDLASGRFREASVPSFRPQADTSERPGEQSLSIEGLWRRSIVNWVLGAGQKAYDRPGSVNTRFHRSRGIDPWEEWEMTLLPKTTLVHNAGSNWTSLVPATFGGTQYMVGATTGGDIRVYTLAGAAQTNFSFTGPCYVTSAGGGTYFCHNGGINRIDDNLAGTTSFNSNITAATLLRFVKGRLMAAKGNEVYDVVSGSTSTPLFTNAWPSYTWSDFGEAGDAIYASGYSGDRGSVWRIPVKTDGTGLDAPRVAVDLPDGELPYAVRGYVGFVVIGTSRGVRVGQLDTDGGIVLGPLVGEAPCRCLEPQDRFCWFGWDDTFTDAAGLGRLDLSRFVEPLGPAYATDVLGATTGDVLAAATAWNASTGVTAQWFAVTTGLYRSTPGASLATGWFTSGWISMGITDTKVAISVDVRHEPLLTGQSISVEFASDWLSQEPVFEFLGTSDIAGFTGSVAPFLTNNVRAVAHQVRVNLNNPDDTDPSPVLLGVTFAAQPSPPRTSVLYLPILLADHLVNAGTQFTYDVPVELETLRQYVRDQRLLRVQFAGSSFLGFIEDYEWIPHHSDEGATHWNGTCVVKVKSSEV